ncbi:MAG: 4Fe-4S dicluster domain-containing protein [Anaerolineae bacterium]
MVAGPYSRHEALATAWVVPDPVRCVQCGICSYCCPVDINVRRHVWLGEPVKDSHCITCGECVARCPRSVLRLDRMDLLGREG